MALDAIVSGTGNILHLYLCPTRTLQRVMLMHGRETASTYPPTSPALPSAAHQVTPHRWGRARGEGEGEGERTLPIDQLTHKSLIHEYN